MTRTDFLATSRPQIAAAAPMRRGWSRALRRLSVLPVGLLLAVALVVPTTAFAAEGAYSQTPPPPSTGTTPTSGYSQTPPPSSTATTPTPSAGTPPAKEKSTPTKTTAPTTTSSAPPARTSPTNTESAKANTLPFTGFDLGWTAGIGLLLMGAGFSIVKAQRRHHRDALR
jgi:cytoskeletal protein RodZ